MRKLVCCLLPLIFFGCSNPGFQKAIQVLRNNRYRPGTGMYNDPFDDSFHDRFKEDMEEEYRRWEIDRMKRRIDNLERGGRWY